MAGMHLALITDDGRLHTLWLPANPEGTYRFADAKSSLLVAARDEAWVARFTAGHNATFRTSAGESASSLELRGDGLVSLEDAGRRFLLFWVELDENSAVFRNYMPNGDGDFSVGRDPSCDIVCANRFFSRRHAILSFSKGTWSVMDAGSTNGVFLNGRLTRGATLTPGDKLYIMGMRIVVGQGFLSINVLGSTATLSRSKFSPAQEVLGRMGGGQLGRSGAELFDRSPRRRLPMPQAEITFEAPPISINEQQIPMMLSMGPTMLQSGLSALTGNFMPLIMSVLFPLSTQKYTDEQKREYERRRVQKYTDYLEEKRREIAAAKAAEEEALRSNYPELGKVLDYPLGGGKLWERRAADDDFLWLRVGCGQAPLQAEVKYPRERFSLDVDAMEDAMYQLATKNVMLDRVPITVPLVENFVTAVKGRAENARSFVEGAIMQLATLHCYDELKIVVLTDDDQLDRLEWFKTLPHAWDNQGTIRFLAGNPSDACRIGEYLRALLEEDLKHPRPLKEILRSRPYYVVFALSQRTFEGVEVLKEAMALDKSVGVSVVAAFDTPPKDASVQIDVSSESVAQVVYLRQIERANDLVSLDKYDRTRAMASMRKLSNTRVRLADDASAMPKTVEFLDMYGVGKVEQLHIARRWRENDPTKSLAVPVGIGADGDVATLDLHQKVHGPHGLVAGMTGSGKSEFLLTYILSLAINFHPDEVSFVLIDYKGGGLAGAFADETRGVRLPHVKATITNLDGPAIERSVVSLDAEVKRRQRVFNEAKAAADESSMDIYSYQRLYRRGVVKEPMPHLFVISDEFAELKQQLPEFLNQLVSIARIGRSLGIHLILATQKPAGVVNDQIRSNSRFKACFKVQDSTDSHDMLGRPEAASIRETGRYYLQVGYNELFALGQSAWSGAPYVPSEEVLEKVDDVASFVDATGQQLISAKRPKKGVHYEKTQLQAVVSHIQAVGEKTGVAAGSLWRPPLPLQMPIDENALRMTRDLAKGTRDVVACLGLIDDPANQTQHPLVVDFAKARHIAVMGDGGSGKTTFIQSMVYTLSQCYGPDQVQFYMLDYSSRMLGTFRVLPHVGCVLTDDNSNQLGAFLDLVGELVEQRKGLFAQLQVSTFEDALAIERVPLIFVVIDNVAGFASTKEGDGYLRVLPGLLKETSSLGISFVFTAGQVKELTSRVKNEVPTRFAFHQKDRFVYGEALGCRCTHEPPFAPGRGMCVHGDEALEFHALSFEPAAVGPERMQRLGEALERRCEQCRGIAGARKLDVIDTEQTYAQFARGTAPSRLALGYNLASSKRVELPLRQLTRLSLHFGNPDGIVPVLGNVTGAFIERNAQLVVVKAAKGSLFAPGGALHGMAAAAGARILEPTAEDLSTLWKEVSAEMKPRLALLTEYCAEHGMDPDAPDIASMAFDHMFGLVRPYVVLFESMADACLAADDTARMVIGKLFMRGGRMNMFAVGCFYHTDAPAAAEVDLYKKFNSTGNIALLFGGRLKQQKVCKLPWEYAKQEGEGACNAAAVYYRDKVYALVMPCGDLSQAAGHPDDEPIF